LLATGAQDVEPELGDVRDAVRQGLVRYCPICDGYEVRDKAIAVLGHGPRGLGEAIFIAKTYAARVTFLTLGQDLDVPAPECARAARAGVEIVHRPVQTMRTHASRIGITLQGEEMFFDTVYSALGLVPRSGLARGLGAKADTCGALLVDAHQRTSVPGLYAAGGVVEGLDQIVVAMGHAAVAATHIHNHCDLTLDED
jgi:thioredoxin reductase (NADPH)